MSRIRQVLMDPAKVFRLIGIAGLFVIGSLVIVLCNSKDTRPSTAKVSGPTIRYSRLPIGSQFITCVSLDNVQGTAITCDWQHYDPAADAAKEGQKKK